MNVLYIVGGEGNRYGSEIIAIDLIKTGRKNEINYTVICANKGAVSDFCDEIGVRNYVIPFTFFVYRAMSNYVLNIVKKASWRARAEYLSKRAIRIIENTVDLKKIDLIHTNLSRDLLGGLIAEKYSIPHVWHIHELYKAHYQLSFLRKDQLTWMSNHANRFIAISKTVAKEWIENGLPEKKMTVVHNGIYISQIQKKNNYIIQDKLKLVMVGHIVPPKGQEAIIRKLSGLSEKIKANVVLDCFGEGTEEYKEHLLKIAQKGGVNLLLKGYSSEIGKILKDYDIGVNCSRGEGFGLSTVEYMAAGICPVVANTGANEEIIINKRNGYVFDYSDDNAFTDLIRYLTENKEEMIQISKQAYKDATVLYSVEKMQSEIYQLYKEMV